MFGAGMFPTAGPGSGALSAPDPRILQMEYDRRLTDVL
jgi:hypothetical protein